MIELLLFIVFTLLSFASVLVVRKINFNNSIKGMDINKPGRPYLPESTGIALLLPLFVGVISLIWVQGIWELLSWFILIAIFSGVGFLDDIKHKFASKTVPWASRALPIAIGAVAFSYFYSVQTVWIIPVALFVAGSASLQNTFAGLNGWEIGTGFIISLATVYILWTTPFRWIAIILSASILGLLLWNKYPAKAFPGDSGTLLIGSALAGLMVINQSMELMMLLFFFFVPHLIDFFVLKVFSNLNDVSQQQQLPYKLLDDGRLTLPDNGGKKTFDFAKMLFSFFGPLREWQVVILIWLAGIANVLFWLWFFSWI